ncbi:MAG: aspartate/glutamate racemase family protein [Candidatus Scalindua sp.]|nr:aspartate/glutamate racemase family protein [Candidatus Scalindua sp.]
MTFSTLGKIHSDIDKVKLILRKKDKTFFNKYCHLFEQLKQSRQRFIDTINLTMEDGRTKPIKLFLVQHNLAFGPGHGVLQFIKEIHLPKGVLRSPSHNTMDMVEKWILEEVEAAATSTSLRHVLHNIKLGGACCAVALLELKRIDDHIEIVPINLTDIEEARLSREIGHRLVKYHIMGTESLWLEPDNLTTNEQIIQWVEDEALKTLSLRQLFTPRDKKLFETLNRIHHHAGTINRNSVDPDKTKRILETPYHDEAQDWLKEWKSTRRGETATEELLSRTSNAGKHYRRQILRISLKYRILPSLAKKILPVQRLLTVMHLPIKDYKPNGQIAILDTGIAPAIVEQHITKLPNLHDEDIVVISVLAKRLGGSSPEMIVQLCRIYIEAAYNLGAKVVLLCNTMDANARETLAKEFNIPILGPIRPAIQAVKKYLEPKNSGRHTIGVIATRATIAAGAYERETGKSMPAARILNVIAPLLATLIDMIATGVSGSEITHQRNVAILEANLLPLTKKNIDILVLGCTHYSVFEQAIHDFWIRSTGKDIVIVNSSRELPKFTAAYLKENRILSTRSNAHKGTLSHIASQEYAAEFKRGVMNITGRNVKVIPMDIGKVVGRLSEKERFFQETVYKESREDVNLRAFIINSNLSAEAKVAIADTLYGAGNLNKNHSHREILTIELTDELMRELVLLAIRDTGMLRILSSAVHSDLEVVEAENRKGEHNIFVRNTTQNFFIIGENNHFTRVLLPSEKNFFSGLLYFKTAAGKFIHVDQLDLSFFPNTLFQPRHHRELNEFNEALKEIKKIKQEMEWNKEYPRHSKDSALKVKNYLDRIGFQGVSLETKKTEDIIHTYVILILMDTEVIVDISASQYEVWKGAGAVSCMRDLGVVVIPRSEVENMQKSDPESLFFYHGKHP